jgi:general secretion pathway protein L
MKLRVFIPAAERPDATTRFAWILFDARRNVLREEVTAAADIPRAADCEAVLPASRVLFARLKLPRVNAATIRELLPYAVEDRLLADPSNIHSVAGRRNAQGETTVAVVDREWLSAMLGALRAAGIRPQRAFCESALLAGGSGDWNVVWGPERGLLVDDEGVGTAFDRGGAAGLPLAIRIALDEAASRAERPGAGARAFGSRRAAAGARGVVGRSQRNLLGGHHVGNPQGRPGAGRRPRAPAG